MIGRANGLGGTLPLVLFLVNIMNRTRIMETRDMRKSMM